MTPQNVWTEPPTLPDTRHVALVILLVAVAFSGVLVTSRVAARLRLPLPAFVLVAAAVVVRLDHHLRPSEAAVSTVVTVGLVAILFQGGMHLGRDRARGVAGPITVVGVAGTFATAGLAAVGLQLAFRLGWYPSFLVATAIAPTDPAVVFSLLGGAASDAPELALLEGESGANDPVGIALMAGFIDSGGFGSGAGAAIGHIASTFAQQMAVGSAVGVIGALVLRQVLHRLPLPDEGMYPLRSLAGAFLLYGLAASIDGSGFLAVFIGGILLGDEPLPYKAHIAAFHDALAGLGEIVAFGALGLTVDLHEVFRTGTWLPGLALGAAVALVIRPIVVWICLAGGRWQGAGLRRAERRFVQLAGLKGAVPILLGTYLLAAAVPDPARLYGIVVVVVLFSVLVQGGVVAEIVARRYRSPSPT